MSAKSMYDIKEILCRDIDLYAKKGSLTRADHEDIKYITGAINNIDEIAMREEQGNSYGEGNWNANGMYSNGAYDGRYSERRGRNSRDAYNDGYSGAHYMRDNYSNDGYNMNMEDRMRREMTY